MNELFTIGNPKKCVVCKKNIKYRQSVYCARCRLNKIKSTSTLTEEQLKRVYPRLFKELEKDK